MKKQISLSEIDTLIRKNIKERGLSQDISDSTIEEIKKKIRTHFGGSVRYPFMGQYIINTDGNDDGSETSVGDAVIDGGGGMDEGILDPKEDQTIDVNAAPESAVSHSTVVDQNSIEVARKEGELQAKEQELARKEAELNAKEEAIKYQPQLPEAITKSDPAQIFVYDMNELNMGAESMTQNPYHLRNNPDQKKTMQQIWLEEGKVRAEVFGVEFKKIGELVFDPFQGVCKFAHMPQPLPDDLPKEEVDSVQAAKDSQLPLEPMVDAIEPVMDVTMSPSTDMGLQGADVQKSMEEVIQKILRSYFTGQENV